MKKEWMDLLLRSLDQALTKEEESTLSKALQDSPALREEQRELMAMRQFMAGFSIQKNEGFIEKVMERIEENKILAKRRITHYLGQIFPKAIAACLIILLSFILYIYMSEGNFDTETLIGMHDLSPEEAYSLFDTEAE